MDLVELCAVYSAAPDRFVPDPSGKKEMWRMSLETSVRKMMTEQREGKLSKIKMRHSAYRNQSPPFTADDGYRVVQRVSS